MNNLTIQEAQRSIKRLQATTTSQADRIAALEAALGALEVGDLAGATTGQQLTLNGSGKWVAGDANPA